MRKNLRRALLVMVAVLTPPTLYAVGQEPVVAPLTKPPEPLKGKLVIVGGGGLADSIVDTFVGFAGKEKAKLVYIPTASVTADTTESQKNVEFWKSKGAAQVMRIHTRSRAVADTEAFVKPLTEATAVWFGGGEQKKILDAYRGTRTERELNALLQRGGVIGGTSAGAAIMSKLCILQGNPVAELGQGFGFLPGAVVDQHFIQRNRADRLFGVLQKNPGWFGLGIDESTAAVVSGKEIRVVGKGYVSVFLAGAGDRPPSVRFLKDGDRTDFVNLCDTVRKRTAVK